MREKEQYFIRIDHQVIKEKLPKDLFDNHLSYLAEISKERTFYGGGFIHNPGGMIIFQADNVAIAKIICDNDPIIKSGYYSYTLNEWEVVIASKPHKS